MKPHIRKALAELKQVKVVARDKFAWPGGYALFIVCRDGAVLCADCCKKEFRQIAYDSIRNCDTGWRFEAVENASNLETLEYVSEHQHYSETTCGNCNATLNP